VENHCEVESDVASVMHTLCNLRLSAKDHPPLPPPPSLEDGNHQRLNKLQKTNTNTKMYVKRNSINVPCIVAISYQVQAQPAACQPMICTPTRENTCMHASFYHYCVCKANK
jgi:hypothetical protein